jgi:ATP-binding cassette subfamily C protein CydC
MAGRLEAQQTAIAAADAYTAGADDCLNRVESRVAFGFGIASTLLLTGSLLAVSALAGSGAITAPVAALGVLIAFAAVEPFSALRRGAMELGRTLLAASRVAPRLSVDDAAHNNGLPAHGAAFELAGISARYATASAIALEDVTLDLACGEKLALVGTSGAGKSTMLALLAAELQADQGTVASLKATLLTQRTELFQDTLRGNLQLAKPEATDDELHRALAAAGLFCDIAALPRGLATLLGEGGMGLSGGQSRRLALARLFLRNTPLWLLDEPTEGLDGATARDVMHRLSDEAKGRSLVIATHIRREAAIADAIAVLEAGRVIEVSRRGEAAFERALNRLRPD